MGPAPLYTRLATDTEVPSGVKVWKAKDMATVPMLALNQQTVIEHQALQSLGCSPGMSQLLTPMGGEKLLRLWWVRFPNAVRTCGDTVYMGWDTHC